MDVCVALIACFASAFDVVLHVDGYGYEYITAVATDLDTAAAAEALVHAQYDGGRSFDIKLNNIVSTTEMGGR